MPRLSAASATTPGMRPASIGFCKTLSIVIVSGLFPSNRVRRSPISASVFQHLPIAKQLNSSLQLGKKQNHLHLAYLLALQRVLTKDRLILFGRDPCLHLKVLGMKLCSSTRTRLVCVCGLCRGWLQRKSAQRRDISTQAAHFNPSG
jgi:hypothetical protein